MRVIILSFSLAFWTGFAAAEDCAKLNTVEFLESKSLDQVLGCVESGEGVFESRDQKGYNLLMTAIGADIHPNELSALILSAPEDQITDIFSAKDTLGRSIGHIAAAEALDPSMYAILSMHGISFSEDIKEEDNSNWAGRTPLHFAAQRENAILTVSALLALGDFSSPDIGGVTPFDIAKDKENIGSEILMLAEGEWPRLYRRMVGTVEPSNNANCPNFLTQAFFEQATKSDVAACLTDKNQLFAVDRDGNSLLHLAAAYSKERWIVDHILAFADEPTSLLSKTNSVDMMPLHFATEQGAPADNLATLLAWGANPNALVHEVKRSFRKNRGLSALHFASDQHDKERLARILVLLAFGADTLVQDVGSFNDGKITIGGRTALHTAQLRPDPVILATLLEAQFWQESMISTLIGAFRGRAIKQITDDAGRTALHFAASRGSDPNSLLYLIDYGFSVDANDDKGLTPLMFAAQNFTDAENFLLLLDHSEKPCIASSTGTTVEALLRANRDLMGNDAEDLSGMSLSPLAQLKQRCP